MFSEALVTRRSAGTSASCFQRPDGGTKHLSEQEKDESLMCPISEQPGVTDYTERNESLMFLLLKRF